MSKNKRKTNLLNFIFRLADSSSDSQASKRQQKWNLHILTLRGVQHFSQARSYKIIVSLIFFCLKHRLFHSPINWYKFFDHNSFTPHTTIHLINTLEHSLGDLSLGSSATQSTLMYFSPLRELDRPETRNEPPLKPPNSTTKKQITKHVL